MVELITDNYAIYQGDCIEKMESLPDSSIDFSGYSPPFSSLYTYSSSDHDLGNCKSYDEFLEHYAFVIKGIQRVMKPGRMTVVHCMDIPKKSGGGLTDMPGDIIRLHQENGFEYWDRKNIWKEPLRVAIRTRLRALMHQSLVDDTAKCRGALADYILIFKKIGDNETPIKKPYGLTRYAGDLELMNVVEKEEYIAMTHKYKQHTDQMTNRLSQFIWRRYASSSWEDIRANRMLDFKPAKDDKDERHVCPLHLDIIDRLVILYSNHGETVLTPFAGIGSEVFSAVSLGRKAVGIELKENYFKQLVQNLKSVEIKEEDQYEISWK